MAPWFLVFAAVARSIAVCEHHDILGVVGLCIAAPGDMNLEAMLFEKARMGVHRQANVMAQLPCLGGIGDPLDAFSI